MSQSRDRSLTGVLLIGVLAIASNACAAHADRQQTQHYLPHAR
ncbi:MAG: hypothetical protein ACJ0BJ_05170 [Pirellulales bacterium]